MREFIFKYSTLETVTLKLKTFTGVSYKFFKRKY